MISYEAQEIKERLTMREVMEHYGYDVNRKGFVCCPFHNEKTPSMKIYAGDGGYYCFGCGEHGDVITFAQRFFGLPFKEALKRLDLDFGLNIYSDHSFDELRRSHYKKLAVIAKREREKTEREAIEKEYWDVFDEWKRLDDNRRLYTPKSRDEIPHPLFLESLQKLDRQGYRLDEMDVRRRAL